MKRIISITLALIMLLGCTIFVSAAGVGETVGYTTYTDIVAYINHFLVGSYNMNGNTVIVAEDLANYGFNVVWDGNMRALKLWVEDGLEMSSVMQEPQKLPPVIMYDEHGRTKEVDHNDIMAQKILGWSEEPIIPITEPTNDAILPFSFEKNIADGIKLCWLAKNVSNKTINYYTIRVYFYNSVGDPAFDEITGKAYRDVKYVGPVEANEELVIFSIVGYVPTCSKVTLGEITLEYSDGTVDEFWYGWNTKIRR